MTVSEKLVRLAYPVVLGVVTALATRQVLAASWRFTTGEPPSSTPAKLATWLLAGGAAVGLARPLAKRVAPPVPGGGHYSLTVSPKDQRIT